MKKFAKEYIYYHLLADIASAIVLLFCFGESCFITDEQEEVIGIDYNVLLFLIVACILIYAGMIVYRWLYIRFSGYELLENEMKCKRGVLYRKESSVEYVKMHAINKKQNIFQKLFGIAELTVDSGSANTAFTAEITVIEKESVVDAIMLELKARQARNTEQTVQNGDQPQTYTQSLFDFSPKRKILSAVINSVGVMLVLLLSAVMLGAIIKTFDPQIIFEDVESPEELLAIFPIITILVYLGSLILTFAGNAINIFIGFYNFKIFKKDNNLEISYGLLQKNCNTFRLDRIKAVKIVQGPIKRIFGFATVNLEVVGYGGDADSSSNNNAAIGVLIPFCKIKEVSSYLDAILPDYVPTEKQHKAKSFAAYIMWPLLITAVIIAGLATILSSIAIESLADFILILIVSGISFAVAALIMLLIYALEYLNNGIAIDDDRITVYNGGLFKKCTIIGKKDLIAMEDITTPMRSKKSIYSFKIHFYTNSATNDITVKNVDASLADTMRGLISY